MFPIAQAAAEGFKGFDVEPLLEDSGIPLAVMGIVVVFAALVLISLFITWLPRLMAALDRLHPEAAQRSAVAAPRPSDELSGETVAVIAAAVATVLDQPHRIIHARELTAEGMAWSLEGRMQHHTSHQLQHRDRR